MHSHFAFVSYVREDRALVMALCDGLRTRGVLALRDENLLRPGTDVWKEIENAIRYRAIAFIACFSTKSENRARSGMREELNIAVAELRLRADAAG